MKKCNPYPGSGNRAFDIKQNFDDSYTIFTRGVDRVRYRIAEIIGDNLFGGVFQSADELWQTFQNNLVDFISDPVTGQGQAQIVPPVTNRVDFEAVRDDLMGN